MWILLRNVNLFDSLLGNTSFMSVSCFFVIFLLFSSVAGNSVISLLKSTTLSFRAKQSSANVCTFEAMLVFSATNFRLRITVWSSADLCSFVAICVISASNFRLRATSCSPANSWTFVAISVSSATNFCLRVTSWSPANSCSLVAILVFSATNFRSRSTFWSPANSCSFVAILVFSANNFRSRLTLWSPANSCSFVAISVFSATNFRLKVIFCSPTCASESYNRDANCQNSSSIMAGKIGPLKVVSHVVQYLHDGKQDTPQCVSVPRD